VLTSTAEICDVLGLKRPKEPLTHFYSPNPSTPMFGEVALVALMLMSSLDREPLDVWVKAASEQDAAFGIDGRDWSAPRSGVWARPFGELNQTVTSIVIGADKAAQCAEALLRFGAVRAAPPIGSITKYFSKLTNGKQLELPRGKGTVGRAPFVFVLAARLIRRQRGPLQVALGAPVTRESRRIAERNELPPESLPFHRKEFDDVARRLEALKRSNEVRPCPQVPSQHVPRPASRPHRLPSAEYGVGAYAGGVQEGASGAARSSPGGRALQGGGA